jgi:putative flippase GtrA
MNIMNIIYTIFFGFSVLYAIVELMSSGFSIKNVYYRIAFFITMVTILIISFIIEKHYDFKW